MNCRHALPFVALLLSSGVAVHGQVKARPLAIEDYYRVLTVTNPQISPDGKTVRFSVTTRVESDNGTRTETFVVPTDGSANDLAAELALSKGERLQWKSTDGTSIEGWLLAPANYDPARGGRTL